MAKHICVVHGYLLCGTGSNIYSCNLALQWKKQGHAVTIFCQDPKAGSYDWVDEFFGPKDTIPKEAPKNGRCRVIVPDIGGLLPVYVYDDYEGYTTKTIFNCTDEEIENHISMTSRAIRTMVNQCGCDKVLVNHALLSPVIAKRALEGTNIPFDVKIHGSAMTFIVKPYPQYKKYAVEGLQACNRIIAGTRHVVDQVNETFAQERNALKLDQRLVIVPPGMDPSVFTLSADVNASIKAFLEEAKRHISKEDNKGRRASKIDLSAVAENIKRPGVNAHNVLVDLGKTYNQRVVDCDLPERFFTMTENDPVVIYFGKFLNTKGIAEILLQFPYVVSKIPNVRFLFVGFGTFREHLEMMVYALKTGDAELFEIAAHTPDENGKPFLESSASIKPYFRKITDDEASRITITGCLNHTELGLLLPVASVSVVASKANEAFGMVSVEAMSAGVFPLCVYHSGLIDVFDQLKKKEPEVEKLMHIDTAPGGDFGASNGADFLRVFPESLLKILHFLNPDGQNSHKSPTKTKLRWLISQKLRAVAEATWSWDGICKTIIEL